MDGCLRYGYTLRAGALPRARAVIIGKKKETVLERRVFIMSQIVASSDFDTKVLGADKPVLVDFFATWCGPCKRLAPVIDELSSELAGKVDVYKLDIDQSPDIAARFKVSSVPTIMLFEGGQMKAKTVGAVPKQQLMQMLQA